MQTGSLIMGPDFTKYTATERYSKMSVKVGTAHNTVSSIEPDGMQTRGTAIDSKLGAKYTNYHQSDADQFFNLGLRSNKNISIMDKMR